MCQCVLFGRVYVSEVVVGRFFAHHDKAYLEVVASVCVCLRLLFGILSEARSELCFVSHVRS